MAATIRLYRIGKKHMPAYRIVVVHKKEKCDGGYIEEIGTYNPLTNPYTLTVKSDRFDYWTKNGAIISEGMRKILHSKKINFNTTK